MSGLLPEGVDCLTGNMDKFCDITEDECNRAVWVKEDVIKRDVDRMDFKKMHSRGYVWQSCGMGLKILREEK